MRLVEHEVDRLETVPVDGIVPRTIGADRTPSRAFPRAGADRTAVPIPGNGVRSSSSESSPVAPMILDHPPGQPEKIVRGVGPADEPGPAVLETVEPVDHVPVDELLGGVQEDLPPRQHGSIRSGSPNPGADHETHTPRWPGKTRDAPRCARPVPDISANPGSGRTPGCSSGPRTVSIKLSHHRRVSSQAGDGGVGIADTCG